MVVYNNKPGWFNHPGFICIGRVYLILNNFLGACSLNFDAGVL